MTLVEKFIPFKKEVQELERPRVFNFPFYYTPDKLALIASEEVQNHLLTQTEWSHNFGLDPEKDGIVIGKMFGVLVVENENKELGYLAAFSGKLADANHWKYFVPPVYDMLDDSGYFKKEEARVSQYTINLEKELEDPSLALSQNTLAEIRSTAKEQLLYERIRFKIAKAQRKGKRIKARDKLDDEAYGLLEEQLKKESLMHQWYYKDLKSKWESRIKAAEEEVARTLEPIKQIKKDRAALSNKLQQWLFDQYQFLDAHGVRRPLISIFENHPLKRPPAGAGECAAPKLLQYAYTHNLKPISIAEFWWGASPKSAIRKHKLFYPACRGKCGPILEHMLQGLTVEDNPLISDDGADKKIETIYEDEHLVVINKPPEFLSVPGKHNLHSVQQRMKEKYPEASGPLVVHRLDMSTSGIMLIAKDNETHKYLQKQFIKRTVKKRYVAVLDGVLNEKNGFVDLPLRVDLDDRPKQLVCYEHGKSARTRYEVIEIKDEKTRVRFYPITGRTHQLRMHAAHRDGLGCPIIGDDLYGVKGERLHLHAEWIEFIHPHSREKIEFNVKAPF